MVLFHGNARLPVQYDGVGCAQMGDGGKSKGPPPAVKKVLSLFGSGREEDKMVGYLSFLKIGPKLLKFLPGRLACSCCCPGGLHAGLGCGQGLLG